MNGMGGMGGGMKGGGASGHMATCPLCRGAGAVPEEVAESAAPAAGGSGLPASNLASAMMGSGAKGGGHRGHGG
jgi:hypothetical protein